MEKDTTMDQMIIWEMMIIDPFTHLNYLCIVLRVLHFGSLCRDNSCPDAFLSLCTEE